MYYVAVPSKKKNLRLAIGEAHRRYTRRINFREGWRGHLWQERFAFFVMDEHHLIACVRYIENNPVRANLVSRLEQWPWSSASANLAGKSDKLVKVEPVLSLITGDWRDFLTGTMTPEKLEEIRRHERTGRPLGDTSFVEKLERCLGRRLKPQKPGRKPKQKSN